MSINPIKIMNVKSFHTSEEIIVCKCGNEPYIGAEFYYKSKYCDETTIGTIAKVGKSYIDSNNGVRYNKSEIEIKPRHILRDEKLNKLGI
jgi:hypothetical protein